MPLSRFRQGARVDGGTRALLTEGLAELEGRFFLTAPCADVSAFLFGLWLFAGCLGQPSRQAGVITLGLLRVGHREIRQCIVEDVGFAHIAGEDRSIARARMRAR